MATNPWDQVYASGRDAELWSRSDVAPELVDFLDRVDVAGVAVDLGCGTGADALFLSSRGFATVGIDLSQVALAQARSRARGGTVSWFIADVSAVPLRDAAADLITDRGCLHHLPTGRRRRYADEVARVLAPDGWAFVRGMCEHGRHKNPVDAQVIRRMFGDDRFEVRAVDTFTMFGPNGGAPACRAMIRRTAVAARTVT